MEYKLYKEPDLEDDHPTWSVIMSALNDLDPDQRAPVVTLFASKDGEDTDHLQFQYAAGDQDGEVRLFFWLSITDDDEEEKLYSYTAKDMDEVKEIFYNYFMRHEFPDLQNWDDNTNDWEKSEKLCMRINIFKESYKTTRPNGKEIYKGFGFKHLSDVTQYYVHQNNQSETGTTSLCQPIGESLVLFLSIMSNIINGKDAFGDYSYNEERDLFYMQFQIPNDWHTVRIVDENICSYKVHLDDASIYFGAYTKDDKFIKADTIEPLAKYYKLLPCFAVLLAKEMETNSDFSMLVENFVESPAPDIFVNLHEDFYQNHKIEEHYLNYSQLPEFNPAKYISCLAMHEAIRENKNSALQSHNQEYVRFGKECFCKEYRSLVPALGAELELQSELIPLCNAVQKGDCRAVLFHGPAGTGKTIACKLICQNIALPIMDTVNCTENLDEFIFGKYIPQNENIVFMESYVAKAVRFGGAVVFEEINFAKPQYLAFLNSLLDDNGFIRLDSGEIIRRHTNFRFFATMNLGYFGTKELNQALFNRFHAIVELAALPDDSIRKMLAARVPNCVLFVDKMLGVYHKLKKKIESEELEIVISPRNLENWARLAQYEGYVRASEKTIIPIAKNDRTLEAAIKGIIYLYKWS
ncbi:MAG: AAA family ATPase [Spirochaetota bacterium]|nr:AAA family ATPase [Spirochaetota bacterium]